MKRKKNLNYNQFDERAKSFFDRSLDLPGRTIYLGTVHYSADGGDLGVDALMAEYLIKGIYLLNKAGKKPIRIITNNPGGSTMSGMAIYDAISASSSPVDIEVYGQASSMGAVILQAGRRRLLHPNVVVMIHDGYIQDTERMPTRSNEAWSDWSKKDRQRMYQIFSKRSNRSVDFWSDKCAHDTIWYADKAVKFGLADEVIYPKRELIK